MADLLRVDSNPRSVELMRGRNRRSAVAIPGCMRKKQLRPASRSASELPTTEVDTLVENVCAMFTSLMNSWLFLCCVQSAAWSSGMILA